MGSIFELAVQDHRRVGSWFILASAITPQAPIDRAQRDTWRMPPLDTLEPQKMTLTTRVWMGVLRGYLVIAVGLVIFKVLQMTLFK